MKDVLSRSIAISIGFFILVFILPSCSFTPKATQKLFNENSKKQYDMIIVPGVTFNAQWDTIMKGRVYWSKYLYDRGIAKNIMYSGSSVRSPYVEAEIMAMYAEALGIPREHIFTETKAEHSTENIYYGYKKTRQMGFEHIALASDPFQTKLLKRYVRRRVSPDVDLLPFVVDTLIKINPTMIDPVIDYEKAFNKDYESIEERDSFWKRLRGTMGRHVDKTAYE